MRANGSRPSRPAAASPASSRAAAPSFMGEALPAVTVPPGRKTGRRRARASSVVSRTDSSRSSGAPGTGTTSPVKRPWRQAAAARCWLRSAKPSCTARLMS